MNKKNILKIVGIIILVTIPNQLSFSSDLRNNKEIIAKQHLNNEKYINNRDSSRDRDKYFLKISDLKDLLINNNQELKIIESKINQSKNILKSKSAAWAPKLNLKSNELPKYTTSDSRDRISGNTSSNQLKFGTDISIEWDIINPKRKLAIKIAKDKLENLNYLYELTLEDLYLKSKEIYYSVQSAEEEINVAHQAIKTSLISLDELNNRYKSGLSNKLEVLEAKTQLNRDRILLMQKEEQLKSKINNLTEILNIKKNPTIENKLTKIIEVWNKDEKESLKAALENRIDLKIKKKDIIINTNESLVLIADKKPNFRLYNTFSISSSKGQLGAQSPDYDNFTKNNTNITGISFNMNLFDGGEIKNRYLSLKNKNQELEASFIIKKNEINKNIKNSLNKYKMIKNNIIFAQQQLTSARETLSISLKRMEAGISTQREVVNSQSDVIEAETNFINSLKSYKVIIATLSRLTGLKPDNICNFTEEKTNSQNNEFLQFIKDNNLQDNCPLNIKI